MRFFESLCRGVRILLTDLCQDAPAGIFVKLRMQNHITCSVHRL